jgi:hypothetical protein
MWKAYWSKVNKRAILFFNLPSIGGGAPIILHAYWGNPLATNISNPDYINCLFYETFSLSPLSNLKWTGNTSAGLTSYGYLIPVNSSFTSITNPLSGKNSWTASILLRRQMCVF